MNAKQKTEKKSKTFEEQITIIKEICALHKKLLQKLTEEFQMRIKIYFFILSISSEISLLLIDENNEYFSFLFLYFFPHKL
jgi:hypothetical protein